MKNQVAEIPIIGNENEVTNIVAGQDTGVTAPRRSLSNPFNIVTACLQSPHDFRMHILVGQDSQRSGCTLLRDGLFFGDHIMGKGRYRANVCFADIRIGRQYIGYARAVGKIFENQLHRYA